MVPHLSKYKLKKAMLYSLRWLAILHLCSLACMAQSTDPADLRSRIKGMLLGSLIGDAAGGPVEFKDVSKVGEWPNCVRNWEKGKKLDASAKRELAESFRLLSYAKLRPRPEPYAHWTTNAKRGTVTDDSRHKIILIDALRNALERNTWPITEQRLAQSYVDYAQSEAIVSRKEYAELCEEGFREYNAAAKWIIGKRDATAQPPSRLWGGVSTNAGQMTLPPLAAVFAGDPKSAYESAFRVGFIDNGIAKDINSAIIAGLAKALVVEFDDKKPMDAWNVVIDCMSQTDPYRYSDIPFVRRPTTEWIDFSRKAVSLSDGNPRALFHHLETNAKPHFYWDAHFVFACALSIIEFCELDPLASLHVAVDLGHDTDSTAQLVGCFVGAIYGETAFPKEMRETIAVRLKADYGQSLDEWVETLIRCHHANR